MIDIFTSVLFYGGIMVIIASIFTVASTLIKNSKGSNTSYHTAALELGAGVILISARALIKAITGF